MNLKWYISFIGFILVMFYSIEGHCKRDSFVIAIDIGHSINNSGAISSRGVGEFYFNKDLAVLLRRELVREGFTQAFLLNEDGADLSLTERTTAANQKKANLFISIHHDSVQARYLSEWSYQGTKRRYSDVFFGYSVFYSEKNKEMSKSRLFANLLGVELRRNGFVPTLHHAEKIEGEGRDLVDKDKGIYRFDDLVVLKMTNMPAVLLECGIIVNRDEEILLRNSVYQRMLVLSILGAIENYYSTLWAWPVRPSSIVKGH
jgi:N-acetylmuramoyl-L-alanine amidase